MLFVYSVGVDTGRAIFILCRSSMLRSGCANSRFVQVNRCAFCSSSYSGWWWLKSPNHMVFRGPILYLCLSQSCIKVNMCVSALLFLQSLYMLMICTVLNTPIISIAVMSRCSNSICFHKSISMLVLTRMTDLVYCGCALWVLGYMMIHCLLVHNFPL